MSSNTSSFTKEDHMSMLSDPNTRFVIISPYGIPLINPETGDFMTMDRYKKKEAKEEDQEVKAGENSEEDDPRVKAWKKDQEKKHQQHQRGDSGFEEGDNEEDSDEDEGEKKGKKLSEVRKKELDQGMAEKNSDDSEEHFEESQNETA